MVEIVEIIFSLIPPLLLLASGWSLKVIYFANEKGYALNYLISLVLGSFVFVIPYLILGSTIGMLQEFVFIHAIIVICLLFYLRTKLVTAIREIYQLITVFGIPKTFLGAFAVFSLLFYSVKVSITCLLGPIVSGDALYFWLSMGKVFFQLRTIPFFDPFHLWTFSAEPLVSSLFSWGFFFINSSELEVFRGISVIFFIALPLLSYEVVRIWNGTRTACLLTLIITCNIPILDYMITIYSFYADTAAILFVGMAILMMRKAIADGNSSCGLISGISIALAMLSKYPFGLLGGAIVVVEMLWLMKLSSRTRVVSVLLSSSLMLLILIAGNQRWSFGSSLTAIVVLGILSCFVIWVTYIDEFDTQFDLKTRVRIFTWFLFGASTSLVWGIRTLFQGASMYGIPFFRLVPVTPEDSLIADILGEISGAASTASSFTPLTLIQFAFNPLLNGFFSFVVLVSIFFAIRKRIGLSLIWVLLFWYIGYLTIMGYYPSGRHLLLCAVFLGPFLSIVLTELKLDEQSLWFHMNLSLLAVLFVITSVFQFATSSLAWLDLGFPLGGIPNLFGIPYTSSFGLDTTPELVQRIGVGALLVSIILLVSVSISTLRKSIRMKIKNTRILVVLALIISSTMIVPLGIHAVSITSGDLLAYDIKGSWNQGDFILASTLEYFVGDDDIILAYGDIVLSYLGFRIIDLLHNGLFALPGLAANENMTQIHNTLWQFGVRFLVLPSNDSYLAAMYYRFISYVPFPEISTHSNVSIKLMELSRWRVYELISF